jgi:hypothetical protein
MILADKTMTQPHTYNRTKLAGRVWHKYVIHSLRHGAKTEKRIADAKAWALDNIEPGQWMLHIQDAKACALFYLADEQDAVLFELGQSLHPGDKRGKRVWG